MCSDILLFGLQIICMMQLGIERPGHPPSPCITMAQGKAEDVPVGPLRICFNSIPIKPSAFIVV